MLKLHGYFRSGTSHRVRIALELKGRAWENLPVHLLKAEQRAAGYLARNPQGLVPTLEDDGATLTQSLAIVEYLEERWPEPPLLPPDPAGRARVRSLALAVACDIHPLNNLRVLLHLKGLGLDREARDGWCRHWITEGFAALERRLASEPETGRFCHGDTVTMADLCLVPQVVSSERWQMDLAPYPTIRRIHDACMTLQPFRDAMPANQPDAEPGLG
ncbi:MAG TPA: maleylacetoacetate isomerase [Geminicoccaceae bacterium]|nr:maleylacetoacetate isomerase [Geminicoccaceae bacterium]